MIVVLILAITQLSCGAVPMLRNVLDAQMIDGVDGFFYDVPDYEDPLLMQHQLSSLGAMPIITLLESAKKRANSKSGDLSEKVRIEDSKRVIDEAMNRLELTKMKLEKGNADIYTDIEKIIQSLKTIGSSVRPDVRGVMNTLQTIMTMARPIKLSELKELITTPESSEKIGVLEKPLSFEKQAISVRVISDDKSGSGEKPGSQDSSVSAESASSVSDEKSSEEEEEVKVTEEKTKPSVALETPPEMNYKTTKPPFEFKMKEKKNTNFDGEDMMSSYKLTWKAAGIV